MSPGKVFRAPSPARGGGVGTQGRRCWRPTSRELSAGGRGHLPLQGNESRPSLARGSHRAAPTRRLRPRSASGWARGSALGWRGLGAMWGDRVRAPPAMPPTSQPYFEVWFRPGSHRTGWGGSRFQRGVSRWRGDAEQPRGRASDPGPAPGPVSEDRGCAARGTRLRKRARGGPARPPQSPVGAGGREGPRGAAPAPPAGPGRGSGLWSRPLGFY